MKKIKLFGPNADFYQVMVLCALCYLVGFFLLGLFLLPGYSIAKQDSRIDYQEVSKVVGEICDHLDHIKHDVVEQRSLVEALAVQSGVDLPNDYQVNTEKLEASLMEEK